MAGSNEEGGPRRSTRIAARPQSASDADKQKPEPKATKPKEAKSDKKPAAKAATTDSKPAENGKPVADAEETKAAPKRKAKDSVDPKTSDAAPEGNVAEGAGAKKPKTTVNVLKVGDTVPQDLTVEDQDGKQHKVIDLVKSTGAVFFMYPKANTPGCTNQAKGFKENYEEFKKGGYAVYGLSADSPKAQTSWKNKLDLPYTLLCDPEYHVIKAFGAYADPKKIVRSHVVVGKGGKLVETQIHVSPAASVTEACAFVKKAVK
ncbi:thioredoxin-like protein [Fimicolochytrium jonesii]|uniref:thioredoxin-like protein n=1 Tax=Fimicolochytrium jonesii TaxID=1396493 RepID=UPI0022FE6CF4|nr:thioredoxin-like protein [Fimicolochytrium jonesii]KAI8822635.1 thioredoxin-like protein [Fimicolochytrium jonesii]